MYLERFLRSRKAQDSSGGGEMEAAKTPLSLILQAVGIIVILSLIGGLGGSYIFASEAGQSSDETFKRFAAALQKVANGSSTSQMVPLSFSDDDHLIAVFDTRPFLKDECQTNEAFQKPEECGNKMCVVMCNEDDGCEDPISRPKVIQNSKFGEVGVDAEFYANLGAQYEPGKEYALIYSDCDGWGGDPIMGQGIKWVLIEAKENYIYITDKVCQNKKSAGKTAECYLGTQCMDGFSPVHDYKCDEGRVCCI